MKTDINFPTAIDGATFVRLVRFATAEGSNIECVCINSTYDTYEMSIYAWRDDSYQLKLNHFGHYKGTKWVQLKPSPEQLATMDDMIAKELVNQQCLEQEKDTARLANEQDIREISQTREFITANFYTKY